MLVSFAECIDRELKVLRDAVNLFLAENARQRKISKCAEETLLLICQIASLLYPPSKCRQSTQL